jgi:hydrogenase maturation protein HypF
MYKLFIEGIVQGVGFRPYIYRKAKEHNLVGSVRNIGNGVEVIINDKNFIQRLTDLPPLAKITQYKQEKILFIF